MAQVAAVRAAKAELRKKLRPTLAAMTDQERREESEILVRKFLATEEYLSCKRISIYLSMHTEVNTEKILEDVFTSGRLAKLISCFHGARIEAKHLLTTTHLPTRTCFIPRFEGPVMDMLRVYSMEDCNTLPRTKWNIRQPNKSEGREEALSSGGLDLILVPGLGFTKGGHRLGRGKGYYDSFYATCVQAGFKPKTVALAFSTQLCEEIPMTEKDITVDKVLFP